MADPLVAAAVYADTRGFLDFSSCDGSRRWWRAARVRLLAARKALDAEAYALKANHLHAELSIPGIDVESVRGQAAVETRRAIRCLKPWLPSHFGGSDEAGVLDLVARYYIMAAPEKLRDWGIDLGPLKPVTEL